MSNVKFEVNRVKYQELLNRATSTGLKAVSEQAATDTNRYVKYDTGTLHDSQRVEYVRGSNDNVQQVILSWNTPYAAYQYFFPTAINHGKGDGTPRMEWAKYAEDVHGKDWYKIMQKAFLQGLV